MGAHLHRWATPPFVDRPGLRFNDPIHAFPSDLDAELLDKKLTTITCQIEEAIGVRPRSFRAGRFGFNALCARSLGRVGYRVDSSVTPWVSWVRMRGLPGAGGGPDFSRSPVGPFWLERGRQHPLLEIPVTIVLKNRLLHRVPLLGPFYPLLLPFLARPRLRRWGGMEPQWLRPWPGMTADDLWAVWKEAEHLGLPVGVMMFHSSELMPRGSPYRPTETAVRDLLAVLDQFFGMARQHGSGGATLTEAASLLATSMDVP